MGYDSDNIFAKILRGEIPADTVFEDDDVLAFKDITPRAPIHVLVIPKAPYVSNADFTRTASEAEIGRFYKKVGDVARLLGLDEGGYRLIVNIGSDGGQEVPHLHAHILGGHPIGPMVVDR